VENRKKIAVIGAGFGGLAAAFDLVNAGNEVVVYDAGNQVGGLAAGFKEPTWDWSVERFYHHWFASDRHMLGLIDELGWSSRVIFPRPYTVMYSKDRFYPFDSIPAAALYPGLGWGANKVRFGAVGLFLRFTTNWRTLEKFTVDAWMRKYAGDKVYEEMWEPLMVGKFGERYARQVNMAWMWARMHARTTRLGTFSGGFQAFSDEFAEHLRLLGVHIHLGAAITRCAARGDGRIDLDTPAGTVTFDQALVTTSPALLSRLAPELPGEYLRGLLELKSMGAVVMTLSLREQLSREGYYWYNLPKKAGFPFLALVEHTNFVSPTHFGGDHIVYAGDYLEIGHEYFTLSMDELLARFLPSFKRINPNFSPDWVKNTWIFSTQYAQPVPFINHSSNIPAIRTPIPGLYFASMSQVYPWDRGTNFAVEIGRRAAGMMLADQTGRE